MPRPEREFFSVAEIPWEPAPGQVPDLQVRILSRDDAGGTVTSLMRFPPGCDTSPNGVQVHEWWEEVLILEGSFTDLSRGETFSAGMYACRPPGMRHGPWRTEHGCVTYQVTYREAATAQA